MNWSKWQILKNEDKRPTPFGEDTWSSRRALLNASVGLLVTAIIGLGSGCGGGGGSSSSPPPQSNPVPSIASLSPSSAVAGAAAQTLTINGANFLSSSTVTYNAVAHTAAFIGSTQLSISLSASDQAVAGSYPVVVTNPAPGGGASNAGSFSVNPAAPTASLSVSPASITLGNSATLTWSSANATSCTAGGAWSGTLATSGTQSVAPTLTSLSIPGTLTYTLTCENPAGTAATQGAELAVAYPTPTGPLSNVRSFEYVIAANTGTPGINSAIANSLADLVILSAYANEPPLDRIAADPTGTKLIFTYVDVAEASSILEPSLFNNGPLPSWFGNPNPCCSGLYTVQYWNPAWEPLIFDNIDQAVANGFDGIFLDVLDGDLEWSAGNPEGNPVYPNAVSAMATLVADIRNYVNTNYPSKKFYLMGNEPTEIAVANVASLKNLDAIFNEVAYYLPSQNNGTIAAYDGTSIANYTVSTLAPLYRSAGVPIFGNDYPTPLSDTSAALLSFELYSSLGWTPSVTTPLQTDNIFSTGPFMFMATPTNPTVTGYPNFVNFLSGGTATNATLVGGNQGDYFIGGPGQNTITGGMGNDTIYAHSANQKGELIVDLASMIAGNGTTPSASIEVNGTEVIQPTQITAPFGTSNQRFVINAAAYQSISSVQIVVTNSSYTNSSNFSNVQIIDMFYNGVQINLALGQYPDGGGPPWPYTNNGTVTFPGSAFAVVSPFPSNTSDAIDGGGGTNTVVYRGPYSNYTILHQSDGSWLVTSASTAEGPDKLTNIQVLVFSDQRIELP
jgi:uncharacterized protein (TIGR01370 family)